MFDCAFVQVIKDSVVAHSVDGVFLDFVHDASVDTSKNYVVYSLIFREVKVSRSVATSHYDVSVYSASLETALKIRASIADYFEGLCSVLYEYEFMGVDLENELHNFESEAKMFRAILQIKILHSMDKTKENENG